MELLEYQWKSGIETKYQVKKYVSNKKWDLHCNFNEKLNKKKTSKNGKKLGLKYQDEIKNSFLTPHIMKKHLMKSNKVLIKSFLGESLNLITFIIFYHKSERFKK